jgi:hypothetical protein
MCSDSLSPPSCDSRQTHTLSLSLSHQAAASMPGNEDANLMAAVISFFVLLGTIGYWMFLRSKAAKENVKALLQGAKDGDTHKMASLIKAGTDVGCKDGVRVCVCVVVSILCMCAELTVSYMDDICINTEMCLCVCTPIVFLPRPTQSE